MSEELLQTIPQKIGKYIYYKLGNTTLNQLKKNNLIKKRNYGELGTKKPDGLVLYHKDTKAVIEFKPYGELNSEKKLEKAIKQEIKVARLLCKIFIVTDGEKTFWINALNGDYIKDAKGDNIKMTFNPILIKKADDIEFLINEIDSSIDKNNSAIRSAKLIDPTPLAARLWQTIWVATGKSPVKCLYNVVELFIFKFLSDLKILDEDTSFNRVYQKTKIDSADALDYYARNSRYKIYQLFPKGSDGTTIINGTIFVNENGEANLSQSILFERSLEHLHKYTEEFGSLTKIDKQFKTKLYESFLKQEVEALGQYFTPRKIIQSVIRMGGFDEPSFQYLGKRICDPFCGVGGFLMEILNMNEIIKSEYIPNSSGKIHIPFLLKGFDKGFEREDERTIILAKSNMLIYLAEILFTHPSCSNEFARQINDTFTLFKDNLGTFGYIIDNEDEKFDIILSNPPYVTSGSGIIKEEIKRNPQTRKAFPINALGLESISIEWIINSLKRGGQAYLIIPDGILGRVDKKLRNFIVSECFLNAIISLPVRTFFPNFEHTYILSITKKHKNTQQQTDPVFTYIISSIGEKLTSINREEIEENDLPEMERLFSIFKNAKSQSRELIEIVTKRCKIFDIDEFINSSHWVIDRWWTKEELIGLGIEELQMGATQEELRTVIDSLNDEMFAFDNHIKSIRVQLEVNREVKLGDETLFSLLIGKRVLKSQLNPDKIGIPVYSANVFSPMGFINNSNVQDFTHDTILWSIDGNFEFNYIKMGEVFATTDHCGTIQILNENIYPEYLLYALYSQRDKESFDRSFRASLSNMRGFKIKIPILPNGDFDFEKQRLLAKEYIKIQQNRESIEEIKNSFDDIYSRFLSSDII